MNQATDRGFSSQDEALAYAIAESKSEGAGGVVYLHKDNCETAFEFGIHCPCEPLRIQLGAEA